MSKLQPRFSVYDKSGICQARDCLQPVDPTKRNPFHWRKFFCPRCQPRIEAATVERAKDRENYLKAHPQLRKNRIRD